MKHKGITLVEVVVVLLILGILAAIVILQFQATPEQRQETTNAATMPITKEFQSSVVTAAEFAEISLKKPNNALLGFGKMELAGGTYTFFLVRDCDSNDSGDSDTLYFLTEEEARKLQN